MAYGLQVGNKIYDQGYVSFIIENKQVTLNTNTMPLEILSISSVGKINPITINGKVLNFNASKTNKYGISVFDKDLNSEFKLISKKTHTFKSLHGKNTGYGNELEFYISNYIPNDNQLVLFKCVSSVNNIMVVDEVILEFGGKNAKYGAINNNTKISEFNISLHAHSSELLKGNSIYSPQTHFGLLEVYVSIPKDNYISLTSLQVLNRIMINSIQNGLVGSSNELYMTPTSVNIFHSGGVSGEGGMSIITNKYNYLPVKIYSYKLT